MRKSEPLYGLQLIKSCFSCPVQEDGLFCRLGPQALADLNTMRQTSVYPKRAVLFVEGQPPQGLFILCSGRTKLTSTSTRGRTVIVRLARGGEVLGLSAVLSDQSYEVSAEALEPVQVNFISRPDFLRFLRRHGDVSLRVGQHLSMELRRSYLQVARIALAPTAQAKLAGLLLEWAGVIGQPLQEGARFELPLTHEEIGELIGSSRETITRLLNEFRSKGLIQTNGTAIALPRPKKIEKFLT